MRFLLVAIVSTFLAACEDPRQPNNSMAGADAYLVQAKGMTTSALWAVQSTTTSALALAAVEVELAQRGQTAQGNSYLGSRSASRSGVPRYPRDGPKAGDRNCSDFSNSTAAQRFFLENGGPALDPYDLDRDGDGMACEWGTFVRSVASQRPLIQHTRPRYTQSRCYVGPRGGTYTLTASGRKNYSGC